MKAATTLQFRNAVRTIACANAVDVSGTTWTEKRPGTVTRYVGFPMWGTAWALREQMAVAVERLLCAQGVTAKARISKGGYLRGVCIAA